MGLFIKSNSAREITLSPPPPKPPIAPKRPAVGKKMSIGRVSAQQTTAALKNTKADAALRQRAATCRQLLKFAGSAEGFASSDFDASRLGAQFGAIRTSLADVGRNLLSVAPDKATKSAMSSLVKGFDKQMAKLLKKGEFKQAAVVCMNYAKELDRIKDGIPSKQMMCSLIRGYAGQVQQLARAPNFSHSRMSDLLDSIDMNGAAILRSASGKHTRSSLSRAFNDYSRKADEALANNDFAALAAASKAYADRLEAII